MGQKPVLPVNIPIPTKIGQNGWCTYPKMVPLVLIHSHLAIGSADAICLASFLLNLVLSFGQARVMKKGALLIIDWRNTNGPFRALFEHSNVLAHAPLKQHTRN